MAKFTSHTLHEIQGPWRYGMQKPAHYESNGGPEGIRTPDPLVANQVLSQLSYSPSF